MRFNKREKITLNISIIVVIILANMCFVYKPMKDKEQILKNNINKINVSKKIVNENEEGLNKKEDIVLTLEKYLKDRSVVNYIKKESESNENICLNVKLSGLSKPVTDSIINLKSIFTKVYLDNIEISKIDEENVECKFQVIIYIV